MYCGNSCSTLAYYARRKLATLAAAPTPATLVTTAPVGSAPPVEAAPVTLAGNLQNVAVVAAGVLLADAVKLAGKALGQWLTPAPSVPSPIRPASWLPPIFQLTKRPLVSYEFPGWEEPRFFVPVPWEGETYYYRAAEDLLFWVAPNGACYPLKQADFVDLAARLQQQKRQLQQVVPPYTRATLAKLPKCLG